VNHSESLYREVPALAPTVLVSRQEPPRTLDRPVAASATGRQPREVHPAEPRPATRD